MKERVWAEFQWHLETLRQIARSASPWVLLVPAVGAAVIYGLSKLPTVAPYLTKDSAEISSPIVLAVAVVISAFVYVSRQRHPYLGWQTLFAFALFLRELHFEGTNSGFYIALIVLLVWASYARERFEPYFSDPRISSLVVAIIWTYAISKTFDRHMWDPLLRAEGLSRDLFEENLELLGHLMYVALAITSGFVNLPARSRTT